MYEEQILNYLEQIEENTESQHLQLIYLVDNAQQISDYTQEILSGDNMIIQQLDNTKDLLGLEALILMTILLYLFIVRSMK